MIIVSSYSHAGEAFDRYKPRHVISILGNDDGPAPSFSEVPAENHLVVSDDCDGADQSAGSRCGALINMARAWDQKEPILIHCHRGVARSMAAAYIILCAVDQEHTEYEIAQRLRKAAPHADPNLLLISEADEILGRDDRMVEAVLDLCPCAGAVSDPIVALPIAA